MQKLFPLLCVTLLPLLGGCANWFAPPVHVDLSTPRSAAMAYLKAVQAGDARTARAACAGTAEQMGWVDGRVAIVDGMRKFDKAIIARFGGNASRIYTPLNDQIYRLADVWVIAINDGEVDIQENKATITPSRQGTGFFSHFVAKIVLTHDKDGWKVNLGQTFSPSGQPDEAAQLTATSKVWIEVGGVFQSVAKEVTAGRYKTADQAANALEDRLAKLKGD